MFLLINGFGSYYRFWKLVSFMLILILEISLSMWMNHLYIMTLVWWERSKLLHARGCLNFSMQFMKKTQKRFTFFLLMFPWHFSCSRMICRMEAPILMQTSCHLLFSMPQISICCSIECLFIHVINMLWLFYLSTSVMSLYYIVPGLLIRELAGGNLLGRNHGVPRTWQN